MPVVGRTDVDDIDVGILGYHAEIGIGHIRSNQPFGFFGRFCPRGYDVCNAGRQRGRIIVKGYCRIAIGMHTANHAKTKDANAVGLHRQAQIRENKRNTNLR